MSHEGSDGSTNEQRVRRAGYKFLRTAENVAAGHKSISQVVKHWMTSERHSANILGDFNEIGGARVVGDDGIAYWCVVFGTPIPPINPARAVAEFVESLNERRREKGLEEITLAPSLAKVAQSLARELGSSDDASPRLEAQAVYERVRDAGYEYREIRLTLAHGHITAKEAINGLAEHADRDQTVFGSYQHLGVGVAPDREGLPRWVILYANPL
jgi:uncharacterized protein YkwD